MQSRTVGIFFSPHYKVFKGGLSWCQAILKGSRGAKDYDDEDDTDSGEEGGAKEEVEEVGDAE